MGFQVGGRCRIPRTRRPSRCRIFSWRGFPSWWITNKTPTIPTPNTNPHQASNGRTPLTIRIRVDPTTGGGRSREYAPGVETEGAGEVVAYFVLPIEGGGEGGEEPPERV
jgi:hypothetical protein